MIKQSICALVTLFLCNIQAAIVLKGDENAAANETFSFAIEQHRQSTSSELQGANLYVAAAPSAGGANTVKNFAVSRITRGTTQFMGLTPSQAKVNGSKEEVANPLHDKGIAFMALFNGEGSILAGAPERPVVVINNDRKTVYFINNFSSVGKNLEVLSAQRNGILTSNIPDTTGATTAGIVGIESAAPFVFAAVRPASGSFGAIGSGVALITVGAASGTAGTFTAPIIIDAPTGQIARTGGNRAVALNVSSTQLKIGSDLASIGTIIDMHWHRHVGRLYIALQITGGAAGTDGGRALVLGRVTDKNVLEIDPIAPTGVFDGSLDKIIGAVGSSVSVSIHKVRGMFTSTSLPYLIVQGNVGSPTTTTRTVFALPIVTGNDGSSIALNGTIANKNAEPEDLFSATSIPLFITRIIKQQATTAAQMPLSSDAATQVGGGSLPDGEITEFFVHADTIFATVQTADVNEKPGVFYSQALFETNGKIKTWTTWRRAIGTQNKVQSVSLDPINGEFSSLVANSSNMVKTVKRTEWKDGDDAGLKPVHDAVDQFFLQKDAGVQGLFDFIVTATNSDTVTPGLLDISALVATGLGKVMLVQTSSVISGGIIPVGGTSFGGVTAFTNGTITQTLPNGNSKIITIEGGVLDDIGPINAAEIARDGSGGANGYLFVGGVNGVAVLSKANGAGWSTATGLSTGFTGLTNGMSFKTVGNYKNVRKLINDDRYLYVLTSTQLDRIDLTVGNVGLGTVTPITIATRETVPGIGATGSFLDALISQQLLVLATNAGLLRIANGLDVRTIDSDGIAWQVVDMPETIGPVQQLFAITKTGRSQDIAQKINGGNFLALSAYRGKNLAEIVRFDVNCVTSTGVIDTTVARITDLFVENIPSYFVNFGVFRNLTATDGALYFGTRSKQFDNNPLVTVLNASGGVQTGSRFLSNKVIPVDLSDTTLIAAMLQSSATGTWLVGTDGGIFANE